MGAAPLLVDGYVDYKGGAKKLNLCNAGGKRRTKEQLTSRERIRKSLAHEEPDRVPLFELAFSTKLASEILGRKVFFPRSGGLSLKRIIHANMAGREIRQRLIGEGTKTQIRLGY